MEINNNLSETSIKQTPLIGTFPSVRLTEVCKNCTMFVYNY